MSLARTSALPRSAALTAVALTVVYALGCSDSGTATTATTNDGADAATTPATDSGSAASDDGSTAPIDAGASVAPVQVTAADFDCILNWTKVRGFRIKRVGGDVAASLAVANSTTGGTYPPGTVIQLVPTEAMVKREPGFSPSTKDWEFFFLDAKANATTITTRGTTSVVNGFGGNCFNCHNQAEPKWDLVCEQNHGCAALPLSSATFQSIQNNDPRCR